MTDAGFTVSVRGELRENFANSTLVVQITNNTQFSNPPPSFFIALPSQLFDGDVQGFQVFDSQDGKVHLCDDPAMYTTDDVPQSDDSTKWQITPPRDANFATGQEIGLQLIFKTQTSGTFKIKIEWDLGEGADQAKGDQSADVTVFKSGESPDIKKFVYKLISNGDTSVQLEWETDPDSTVKIYRGDQQLRPEILPAKMQDWQPQDGLKLGDGLEVFRLDATNKTSSRTVSRWQFVSSKAGWHQERGFGELLCLVNDSDNALYGVLSSYGGKAALHKFTVRIDKLSLADDFNVDVPVTMRTSPGAFFQNAIWLVGGSQVDPGGCSNEIWCYQPTEKKAHSFTANWPARMGHGLVVFQNRLWILGGLDANGNALADVWVYEGKDTFNQPPKADLTWTSGDKLPKPIKLPNPACQPSVAAFTEGDAPSQTERLWLTGGADSPWGTPQPDTYCLELTGNNLAEGTWNKVSGLGDAVWSRGMFANALCVGQGQGRSVLYWLVTRRSDASGLSKFDCSMFQVVHDPGKWNATADPLYPLINVKERWPTQVRSDRIEPFRLTAVSFKNFVFVYSLFYRASMQYFAYLLS